MRKAFTLIELLIVIAILGILAVGILIALDPVEQTRRATDSTIQQSAVEVKDAINRYYASKLYFPWCTSASAAGSCTYAAGCADGTSLFDDQLGTTDCAESVLVQLTTSTGELKSNPPANITQVLNLTTSTAGTAFALSWDPKSKSFETNYNYLYQQVACTTLAISSSACATANPSTCYYCIK